MRNRVVFFFMGKNNKTIVLNIGECKSSAHLCEQVNDLLDLGMQIKDYDFALKFLFKNEYYRFRGYCYQFIKGNKINGNIAFEDILDIYYFDDELRQLLLKYLRHIELSIKSIVSYYHTIKYGSLCYLDDKLFINKANHADFLDKAKKEIGRSDEVFIKHHINNKNSVFPFWVVCEVLTFGTISKYYNNMLNTDKTAISKKFYGVDRKYIENWLLVCSYIRNLCAHNARLYNRKFIQATVNLPKKVKPSNSNLFDRLIPISKMLDDENKNRFVREIEELIDKHIFAKKNIDFPNDWKLIL